MPTPKLKLLPINEIYLLKKLETILVWAEEPQMRQVSLSETLEDVLSQPYYRLIPICEQFDGPLVLMSVILDR